MRFPRLFKRAGSGFRLAERLWAFAVLAAIMVLRVIDPAPVQIARLKVFDVYQTVKPAPKPAITVTIVDIDEESIAKIGQWPWPRTVVADLILKLRAAGAVVIGFDVVFPEPDRMSPAAFLQTTRGLDPTLAAALKKLPDNDDLMASAMRQTRVVLGQSGYERTAVKRKARPRVAQVAMIGGDPKPFLFEYPGLIRNITRLEKAARGVGMITMNPERDGVVRRVPLAMQVDRTVFPSLAFETLRIATGGRAYGIRTNQAGIVDFIVAGRRVPTSNNGEFWIHFRKMDRSRYVSVIDVLAGKAPPALLRNKIVLVGTSAIGLRDIKATPLDAAIPGVEAQAFVIENIVAKRFLYRPPWTLGAEVVLTALTALMLIVLVPIMGAVRSLVLGLVGFGVAGGAVWYYFTDKGVLLDLTFPATTTFAVFAVLAFMNYVSEEKSKQQVRGAFSRYMSPALVEQLADDPDKLVLGGESKELSILFSDIRGFTTISEGLDAQELTSLINAYLTPMTEVILEQTGTIDKYIGDAIMAFWNAPLDDDKHIEHSCRAALGMIERLAQFNEDSAARAKEAGKSHIPINIGIGINTGVCSVGNMGSDQRFDYSLLGDAVNLAARLESSTKNYGVDIIIGETTRAGVPDFATMELDVVKVKGKTEASRIFALFGDETRAGDPDFLALKAANDKMLDAAREGDWTALGKRIAECRKLADGKLTIYYDMFAERQKAREILEE